MKIRDVLLFLERSFKPLPLRLRNGCALRTFRHLLSLPLRSRIGGALRTPVKGVASSPVAHRDVLSAPRYSSRFRSGCAPPVLSARGILLPPRLHQGSALRTVPFHPTCFRSSWAVEPSRGLTFFFYSGVFSLLGIPGVSSRFSHQIDSDQLMGVRSLLTLPHILTPELFTSLPTPLLGLYGNRPSPFVMPLVLRGRR